MNRKIVFGSILVLILLLLMPTIPAIQQKTSKEELKQELLEKLNIINPKDFEDIKELEWMRHPTLFALVTFIYYFQLYRGYILLYFSATWIDGRNPHWEPVHPILFLRSLQLLYCIDVWYVFWMTVSDVLGWNWDI